MSSPPLLSVIETGGYAHLVPIYRKLGFSVELMPSVRKAQSWLKRHQPAVVVAEFSFDPGFRDRMSNLESLLASLHKSNPEARVVVLIEKEHLPRLEGVKARYPIHEVLTFPIDGEKLEQILADI